MSIFSLLDWLKKPLISFTLRVLVSLLLVALLFNIARLDELPAIVAQISPVYIAIFLLLYFTGMLFVTLRWRYLLQLWGLEFGFGLLFRWLATALFLNNFLPGGLGGDAYRLYAGSRDSGKIQSVAAVIFYERVLSYSSLVALGMFSLILRADFSGDALFWFLLGGISFGVLFFFALIFFPQITTRLVSYIARFSSSWKFDLHSWLISFQFQARAPVHLAVIAIYSFAIQFLDVFSYYLIAQALHLPVRLGDLFLFVPLLYLATLLPFSLNGIGIRETVFVFFAATWGISPAAAVAFSLTVFTLALCGSLVGGALYWLDKPPHTTPTVDSAH